MLGQALRNFAIELLDDEHGVNSQAWDTLADMLGDNEDNDILDAVKAQDGRFYLPEPAATELRKVIPNYDGDEDEDFDDLDDE